MAIIAPSSPLASPLVPAGSAARSTVEGYDPKIHDKFFEAVNTELGEQGFLTTTLDDVINWART
ncbi:MAG: NADH-quinone oxidoreductase subunit B, partial [Brevundimonas sp.]